MIRKTAKLGALLLAAAALSGRAGAQEPEPVALDPEALEELVAPIALYPDDVLGIILPASTFPLDIVNAARFLEDLEEDPTLEPDDAWDDSVVALLNYPEVVRMLNEDLDWTWALGEAVLADQAAVLEAAQRFRSRAYSAGNLTTDDRQTVGYDDGAIRIRPADPKVVYIPIYDPYEVVVYQPRPVYRYYPVAYPVYYYPYPASYSFGVDYFWGVTSYFSIGWRSSYVHVHHHTHRLHPYYLNSYYFYTPYYPRSRVNVTVSVNNYTNVWRPSPRRGARPRTATVESRSSAARTRRTATAETQPNVSSRTRTATTSQRTSTSQRRTTTSQRPATSSGNAAARSARTGTARAPTTRSVPSSPDAATSARSIRTRPAPSTGNAQSGRTRQSANTRPATPRATITSQGSTRRAPAPSTRTPSATPSQRSSGGSARSSSSRQRSSGNAPRTRQR